MKYSIHDIGGEVIKNDETYKLIDNKMLTRMVLSQTILHPHKSTRGHKHPGQEEIYFFVSGKGKMELDDEVIDVSANTVVLVPDGVFHRVHNNDKERLIFNCVFEGKRNH